MNEEQITDNIEFTMKPSAWVTIGWILAAFISAFLGETGAIVAIGLVIIWIAKLLIVKFWEFQFQERTITERKGVFTIHKREIHYFRIKSIRVYQPFLYRFVGLITYDVITSDPLIPIFRIYAIEDNGEIREFLKKRTTYWRKEMGVKETDFHSF